MKKYLKVLISMALLLVGFTAFNSTVEAAKNPISPKQSRVTYTLKDANGVAYKVYFAGVREKKAIASKKRTDWATADGTDADEGDLLYTGNYTLYTHNPKISHIKKSKFYFKDYLLNSTRKTVHMFPSKYKGQPDILAVAYSIGEGYECADWFYMKNGVLTKILYMEGNPYSKRAQNIGKNTFLTTINDTEWGGWLFAKTTINPAKTTEVSTPVKYNNPGAVLRNWKKHWQ